jgi:ABC-type antimicrobial peptide transport system permease subunit
MSILSYRQGIINIWNSDAVYLHDYSVRPAGFGNRIISEDTFHKLIDYNEIKDFMRTVGVGASMALTSMDLSETVVSLDGHIIRGMITWRLPADNEGYVHDRTILLHPYMGRPLSLNNPYEIMLGDKLLRGLGDPAAFIGKELMLYGNTYTVSGILHDTDVIVGNLLSRNHAKLPFITFQVPERSADVRQRLAEELKERFEIIGLQENIISLDGSYYTEMNQQIRNMLIIALLSFGFCVLNSFGIINSFLADNSKKVYVKFTMGAKRRDIFFELMVFWGMIILFGSLLAFGAVFGVREYMAKFFHHQLAIGWRMALLLPLCGLATAVLMSLYSVFGIARRLA